MLHFCQSLPQPVTFITRLRLDAGLYEPAPARLPGQNGRPRVKGRRLPTLKKLIDHSGVPWEQVSVAWYDGATRTVEIISQTAVWYHTGNGEPPGPTATIGIPASAPELHIPKLREGSYFPSLLETRKARPFAPAEPCLCTGLATGVNAEGQREILGLDVGAVT